MINEYIDKTLRKSNISKSEKLELKEQFLEHLLNLKEEFIDKGHGEKEAEALAIKEFGDTELISEMFNEEKRVNKYVKVVGIILLIVYSIIYFLRFYHVSGYDAAAARYRITNLIPFDWIYKVVSAEGFTLKGFSLLGLNDNLWLEHLTLAFWIMPIGILVPLAVDKMNSNFFNIKVLVIITVVLQLAKLVLQVGRPHIDYAMIQSVGCIIGFIFIRLIASIPWVHRYIYE